MRSIYTRVLSLSTFSLVRDSILTSRRKFKWPQSGRGNEAILQMVRHGPYDNEECM